MRRTIAVTLLAFAVFAAACGSDTADTTQAAPEAAIEIEGFSFGDPLEVVAGTDVTVTNLDSVPHTWTSTDGLFDSGPLDQGATYSFTFDEPGTYTFSCEIHPSMTGTITVTG